jgi:predicted Ser/Thr protein kinase
MFKLLAKTPVTPKSLFITDVTAKMNLDYVGMGGFGYVFEGEYKGSQVALKVLYRVRHRDVSTCPCMTS